MALKYNMETVRRLCKKYNYGFTQEGETYHIRTDKGLDYSFSHEIQLLNWFRYHNELDRNGK